MSTNDNGNQAANDNPSKADSWKKHCENITQILKQRKHDECDFQPLLLSQDGGKLVSAAMQALHKLDHVIFEALLHQEQYDICGRAFMVESALLDDMAKLVCSRNDNNNDNDDPPSEASPPLVMDRNEQCLNLLHIVKSHSSSGIDRQEAYQKITSIRDESIQSTSKLFFKTTALHQFSNVMESMARVMTEICVSGFLHDNNNNNNNTATLAHARRNQTAPVWDQWVIATSPARVDLAGGWSDTPPVCYEYGSAVTGMAVTVDHKKPLSCRCRIVSTKGPNSSQQQQQGVILIRSELRDSLTFELTSARDMTLSTLSDLSDARDPQADGALIKCALLCLGLVSMELLHQTKHGTSSNHNDNDNNENNDDETLQSCLDKLCQCQDETHVRRMEIVITSLLPQGSGMGTSSILGGCILAAVGRCVGMEHSTHPALETNSSSNNSNPPPPPHGLNIIDSVSVLEQILSTGGGFQDQVNGLIGGTKTVTCQAGQLPIQLSIEPLPINASFEKEFNQSLLLAFTGKTRLAKNILQNVLRRFARRTPEVVKCMQELVEGAHRARQAMQEGDLQSLGRCLERYYAQKKHMAGEESGVEPELVRRLLLELKKEELICGSSLCGAGGGGFLVLMAAPGVEKEKIRGVVQECLAHSKESCEDEEEEEEEEEDLSAAFSWHECQVCQEGLTTRILSSRAGLDSFDASWHNPGST